jgi:hypothetical protein
MGNKKLTIKHEQNLRNRIIQRVSLILTLFFYTKPPFF